MNFEDYYPGTHIKQIEYQDDIIIIHAESSPRKKVRTIHDLPIFGKKVIIKISDGDSYEWIGTKHNTKRLNKFITCCCRLSRDGNILEDLLALGNIRCAPSEVGDIIPANSSLYDHATAPVSLPRTDTRGAKPKLDFPALNEALKDVLSNGLPCKKPDDDCQLRFSVIDYSQTRLFDFSYRKIQEYIRENIPEMENLSLQTLYQYMKANFPKNAFLPAKPSNISIYRTAYNDYFQLYFYEDDSNYCDKESHYRLVDTKPAKSAIEGKNYAEILENAKKHESLTLTVSASEFRPLYFSWISTLLFVHRLTPAIELYEGDLSLLWMSFDAENNEYVPTKIPTDDFLPRITTDADPTVTVTRLLYHGVFKYGMLCPKWHGALIHMVIPKEGKIEIGIAENFVRFSFPDNNYLIPTLKIRNFIP